MDPNATLRMISECLASGDEGEANDHARDLRDWLVTGGFDPEWTSEPAATEYYEKQFPPKARKTTYTAAIYFVERCYGGPQEGGWWYDAGEPSDEHAEHTRGFRTAEEASAYGREVLRPICDGLNEDRRELGSVLSDGEYQWESCEGNPKPFPSERPFYE